MASDMISKIPATIASVQEAQATRNKDGNEAVRGKVLPQDGRLSPQQAEDGEQQGPVAEEQLVAAVSNVKDFVQQIRRELQFSIDKDSGRTVVKVINAETDEVVRQIPAEEVLAMARRLADAGSDGLLLRGKA